MSLSNILASRFITPLLVSGRLKMFSPMMEIANYLPEKPPIHEVLKKRSEELGLMYWESSPLKYFGGTRGDGLRLSWAQKVNTRSALQAALRGPACILEGDVVMWRHMCRSIPMMSESDDQPSELSLANWLCAISQNRKKGVMLHFHSKDVIQPSLNLLSNNVFMGPVILKADILRAEPDAPEPVDESAFLAACKQWTSAILCVGWTAHIKEMAMSNTGYSQDCLREMFELLQSHRLEERNIPVMLSMNAMILQLCIPEVKQLLNRVPNSSLYVWTNELVPVSHPDDLQIIRNSFYMDRVFYSLPEEQISFLETFLTN